MDTIGAVVCLGYYAALITAIGGLARLSARLAVLSVKLWSVDGLASQIPALSASRTGDPWRQKRPCVGGEAVSEAQFSRRLCVYR